MVVESMFGMEGGGSTHAESWWRALLQNLEEEAHNNIWVECES